MDYNSMSKIPDYSTYSAYNVYYPMWFPTTRLFAAVLPVNDPGTLFWIEHANWVERSILICRGDYPCPAAYVALIGY